MVAAGDPHVVSLPHLVVDHLFILADKNTFDLEIRSAVLEHFEIRRHVGAVLDQVDHA
jgi:hypothetical protein